MDILDLVFRARTAELDQAEKKLDGIGKKAEAAEKKAKGLDDVLGGFSKLGGPLGSVADSIGDVADKADAANGAFSRVGGGITLIGTAAAATVAAAVGLTLKVADMADALNDMANRTNMSTERLSLLDAMAKMAGSSVEELVSSSERLGAKLAKQDEESGKAVLALKDLGISTKDANGEFKSMVSLQEEIVLAVDNATNKAKAEGAAVMLLGNDYYKLRTAIRETAEQKAEMYDYMQRVGAVVTSKLAKDSDELNDNIAKLGLSFKGMGNSIASITVPILNAVITKLTSISEKAADIMRRWAGGSTASELSGDALADLGSKSDAALATVKRLEGTPYADTAQGSKALEQARAEVTAINDQIREMQRLKTAADSAAASVKAAVTNGSTGEGNRPTGRDAKGDKTGKADDSAKAIADAAAKEQAITDEAWKFYNQHVMAQSADAQKKAEAFQKQADAVRNLLNPMRELNAEIARINENPFLTDEEKVDAVAKVSEKWVASMGKMKESTQELNDFSKLALDSIGNVLSDIATGAEVSGKAIARAFIKAVYDMLVLEPMLKYLKKLFDDIGSGSGGSGGIWGSVISAAANLFGGGRATGGPVSSGRLYEVNERGTPELLVSGNKQYLMMGAQGGYVKPMSGGGVGGGVSVGQVTLQVHVQGTGDAKRDGELVGNAAAVAFVKSIAQGEIANALRYGGQLNR